MMKRLTCTLAALAMLISICPPAQAEFKGTLQRDQDLVIGFDNSSSAGQTAVTVFYLGRRNDDIEIMTVPPNARIQLHFSKPGRGVIRIIVEVNPPKSTTVDVDVRQNGLLPSLFPIRSEGDSRIVFDVE